MAASQSAYHRPTSRHPTPAMEVCEHPNPTVSTPTSAAAQGSCWVNDSSGSPADPYTTTLIDSNCRNEPAVPEEAADSRKLKLLKCTTNSTNDCKTWVKAAPLTTNEQPPYVAHQLLDMPQALIYDNEVNHGNSFEEETDGYNEYEYGDSVREVSDNSEAEEEAAILQNYIDHRNAELEARRVELTLIPGRKQRTWPEGVAWAKYPRSSSLVATMEDYEMDLSPSATYNWPKVVSKAKTGVKATTTTFEVANWALDAVAPEYLNANPWDDIEDLRRYSMFHRAFGHIPHVYPVGRGQFPGKAIGMKKIPKLAVMEIDGIKNMLQYPRGCKGFATGYKAEFDMDAQSTHSAQPNYKDTRKINCLQHVRNNTQPGYKPYKPNGVKLSWMEKLKPVSGQMRQDINVGKLLATNVEIFYHHLDRTLYAQNAVNDYSPGTWCNPTEYVAQFCRQDCCHPGIKIHVPKKSKLNQEVLFNSDEAQIHISEVNAPVINVNETEVVSNRDTKSGHEQDEDEPFVVAEELLPALQTAGAHDEIHKQSPKALDTTSAEQPRELPPYDIDFLYLQPSSYEGSPSNSTSASDNEDILDESDTSESDNDEGKDCPIKLSKGPHHDHKSCGQDVGPPTTCQASPQAFSAYKEHHGHHDENAAAITTLQGMCFGEFRTNRPLTSFRVCHHDEPEGEMVEVAPVSGMKTSCIFGADKLVKTGNSFDDFVPATLPPPTTGVDPVHPISSLPILPPQPTSTFAEPPVYQEKLSSISSKENISTIAALDQSTCLLDDAANCLNDMIGSTTTINHASCQAVNPTPLILPVPQRIIGTIPEALTLPALLGKGFPTAAIKDDLAVGTTTAIAMEAHNTMENTLLAAFHVTVYDRKSHQHARCFFDRCFKYATGIIAHRV